MKPSLSALRRPALRPAAAALIAPAVLVLAAGPPGPRTDTTPSKDVTTAQVIQRVGVGSCVASGCHGGAAPEGIRVTAYTTWVRRDPHARAFDVLFDEASVRIAEALPHPRVGERGLPPEQEPRCLACHAHPGAADELARGASLDSLRDGVDRESCP